MKQAMPRENRHFYPVKSDVYKRSPFQSFQPACPESYRRVQPLRSAQSFAAVQSSKVQEFNERAIDRNFQVSGTDGKRNRRRYLHCVFRGQETLESVDAQAISYIEGWFIWPEPSSTLHALRRLKDSNPSRYDATEERDANLSSWFSHFLARL
jgi:hypothetical protein